MKKVTVDLTIRVQLEIPETMEVGEAMNELSYTITGDENDCVLVNTEEMIDFEVIDSNESVAYMGRLYKVEATFAEHDVAYGNAIMAANPEWSLLCIKDGVGYLVRTDDLGTLVD